MKWGKKKCTHTLSQVNLISNLFDWHQRREVPRYMYLCNTQFTILLENFICKEQIMCPNLSPVLSLGLRVQSVSYLIEVARLH